MTSDVLIIGAGLAGLMAAQTLKAHGFSVMLVDKGTSVGGRLATRRIGDNGLADHGAQFFTVRTPALESYVEQWIRDGLIYIWGMGWSDGSLKHPVSDGHPRYAVKGGMNNLAKHLAKDLSDIHLSKLITSIQLESDVWTLQDETGEFYKGCALLLTAPVPQSLDLLKHSAITLADDDLQALEKIQFGACLCGIHEIEGKLVLPEPGAIQNFQNDVYWIADNQQKGISEDCIVTTHAGTSFSQQNWDVPEANVIAELESALKPYLQSGAKIIQSHLKKWRYSVPLVTHPDEYLLAQNLPPLAFAGDGFGHGGRVEGAFLSGIAAGNALIEVLA